MLAIFNVVVPVFAIIGLGYLAVRFKLYPREGVRGLVAFVNNFATPCLLFHAMATADFSTEFNWAVIIPFYVGALVVFAVASVVSVKVFGNRPGEGVSAALPRCSPTPCSSACRCIQRAYGDGALRHDVLDHRLPRLGAHHHRHAGDGARAPRRRAAPSGAGRCRRPHRLQPAALGHRRAALPRNYLQLKMPEPVDAFLVMMAAAVDAGRALRSRRRAQRVPALRKLGRRR